MTDSAGRSSRLHKQLWRAPQPTEAQARRALFGKRLLFLAVTAALLIGFALSITSIYRQPRTHLFLFEDQIPDYRVLENVIAIPPLPYPHDADKLFSELIPPATSQGEKTPAPRCLRHPVDQLQDLGEAISAQARNGELRHHDVAIIYVRAQGLVIDGDPVLLTHTGNPRNPVTRVSVSELLDSLNVRTHGTLLLLDYGNLEADVAAGVLVNPFADALESLLASRDHPNLWVVASHDLFEASYVSDADARTVFETVASHALAGAADRNQDGWVLTGEFLSYLKQQVARRIHTTSEGMLEQTVRVFRTDTSESPRLSRRIISSPTTSKDTANSTPTPATPVQAAPAEAQQSSLWPKQFDPSLAYWWQTSPSAAAGTSGTTATSGTSAPASPSGTGETTGSSGSTGSSKTASNPPASAKGANGQAPALPADAADAVKAAEKEKQKTQPLTGTLGDCWKVYDQLRELPAITGPMGTTLPLSCYAPTAWKQLESVLVHATMLAERPGAADTAALQELLNDEVLPLAAFEFNRPLPEGTGLALTLDSAVPRGVLSWPDPYSTQLPPWIASIGHQDIDPTTQQQLQEFQQLLKSGPAASLSKWLTANPAFVARFDEASLASQLLSEQIEWPVCQAAVEAHQASVRSRLTLYAENEYVQDLLSQGDELLAYGLLLLDDRAEAEMPGEMLRSFTLATERYDRAFQFCNSLARLQRDVWHCSVDANAVRFLRQTSHLTVRTQPPPTSPAALKKLANLQAFLNKADSATPASLARQQSELIELRALSPWNVVENAGTSRESFLKSAPLSQVARSRLSEKENSTSSKPKHVAITPDTTFQVELLQQLTATPLRPFHAWHPAWERAERALGKAQLAIALWGTTTPEFQRLEQQYAPLKKLFSTPNPPQEAPSADLFDNYGDAVVAFLRSQYDPEQTPSLASSSGTGRQLRYPFVLPIDASPSTIQLDRLQLNHHFWTRTVKTAAQALRTQQTEPRILTPSILAARQRRVNDIRPAVAGQPIILPIPARPLPVQAEQLAPAELLGSSEAEFAINLVSLQSINLDTWLAVDLNPDALQLEWIQSADTTIPVPRWHTERQMVAAVDNLPDYRPLSRAIAELSAANTGLTLPAGGQRELRFRLTRVDPQAKDLVCFLHFAAQGRILRVPVNIDAGPDEPVTLALNADTAQIRPEQRGWSVRLRPDTPADFQLTADNSSSEDQQLTVSVIAPTTPPTDLPFAAVDAATGRQLLQQWGQATTLLQLNSVKVPGGADQAAVTPVAPPATPKPALPSAAGGKTAKMGPSTPLPPPVSPYLVLVMQNQTGGQYTFLPIDVEVLHPREYVAPAIAYASGERTLSLQFERTIDEGAAATPIQILATVAFEGSTDSPARFPMTIAADQSQASFQTQLPPADGRDVLLNLTVDGYPRAFRYQIATDRTLRNIPTTSQSQLKILSPAADSAYGVDEQLIPVQLKADLGVGGGDDADTYLEFGIDVNRDRDLYQDPSVKIPQDRLPRLYAANSPSQLTLRGAVEELSLLVPIDKLANRRVNLIGRVHKSSGDVWSLPTEIILDSDPPRVLSLEPLNKAVIGKPLSVSATADDGNLSGVASVEVVIDSSGKGDFTPTSAPVKATQNDQGEWTAQVPLSVPHPGGYLLLGRATDRAGNVSPTFRTLVTVISAQQEQEMQNAPVKVVRGVVTYGKQPISGATATLTDEKSKVIATGKTDNGGRFVLDHLPPGKYKLEIRAIERGKIRTVDKDIELKPDSPEINEVFPLPQ